MLGPGISSEEICVSREARDFGSVGLERGIGPGGGCNVSWLAKGGGLDNDLGGG